ncbi:MAG: type II toxin-antitoxin system HicA family toxin [Candidatus Peregrinibacteria bacterium]|nr:type II toxin-antitoxin system HicA family toxin [Candidatus Peregrinibacteria bacterium]
MLKLPAISGRNAVKRFERHGYRAVRQRGSHIRLIHSSNPSCKPLTIPDHAELGRGLLRKLLRDAQLTLDEFLEL